MPNTKTGTTWAPDIRPENIETFTETYTPEGGEGQTVEYKRVADHPILNGIRDIKAFFTTHAGAVWYNLAERKTLLAKLNELDAELREVNAKMEGVKFIKEHFISPPSGVSVGASSYTNHVVDVSKEGYVPIALVNIWSGNSSIVLYGNTLDPLTGRAVIGLKNTSTSSQAGVVRYSVLYEVAE